MPILLILYNLHLWIKPQKDVKPHSKQFKDQFAQTANPEQLKSVISTSSVLAVLSILLNKNVTCVLHCVFSSSACRSNTLHCSSLRSENSWRVFARSCTKNGTCAWWLLCGRCNLPLKQILAAQGKDTVVFIRRFPWDKSIAAKLSNVWKMRGNSAAVSVRTNMLLQLLLSFLLGLYISLHSKTAKLPLNDWISCIVCLDERAWL